MKCGFVAGIVLSGMASISVGVSIQETSPLLEARSCEPSLTGLSSTQTSSPNAKRKSVNEEDFVRTTVISVKPSTIPKHDKEVDRKEKKEREREEKERKKRDKKEKEQREREEKERKEKEKKDRKDRERKEKEERQKREREVKKSKSQTDKSEREVMEKERQQPEQHTLPQQHPERVISESPGNYGKEIMPESSVIPPKCLPTIDAQSEIESYASDHGASTRKTELESQGVFLVSAVQSNDAGKDGRPLLDPACEKKSTAGNSSSLQHETKSDQLEEKVMAPLECEDIPRDGTEIPQNTFSEGLSSRGLDSSTLLIGQSNLQNTHQQKNESETVYGMMSSPGVETYKTSEVSDDVTSSVTDEIKVPKHRAQAGVNKSLLDQHIPPHQATRVDVPEESDEGANTFKETLPTVVGEEHSNNDGTSHVLTTFKTEKVSMEPGRPPHVVNTVTEKVMTSAGFPKQEVVTVTDKTFNDFGVPDQVITTVTNMSFTQSGFPSEVTKTTTTERVFLPQSESILTSITATDPTMRKSSTDTDGNMKIDTSKDQTASSSRKEFSTQASCTEMKFSKPETDQRLLLDSSIQTQCELGQAEMESSTPGALVSDSPSANLGECYVTTPTMQRRAHSLRRSHEQRSVPVDVSYIEEGEFADNEQYIVTEPTDDIDQVDARTRIHSSPEILNVPIGDVHGHQRFPDQARVKFQLGSLDSQDSVPSDPCTPVASSSRHHKFTVEKVDEEAIQHHEAEIPFVSIKRTTDSPQVTNNSQNSELTTKLRRVERHFERMASRSLAEGASPVYEVDYQRVLSQLSQEDVALSEDEYDTIVKEQVATPSDECESRGGTDESPEGIQFILSCYCPITRFYLFGFNHGLRSALAGV